MKISLIKNDQNGFSLVEQLFALIILSLAVLSVVPVLTASLHNIKEEDFRVKASNLAQEMVESAKGAPYDELQNGTYVTAGDPPSGTSIASAFNAFSAKVTDPAYIPEGSGSLIIQSATAVTTSADIKEVKVTVQWREGTQTKTYLLPTYVYNVAREP